MPAIVSTIPSSVLADTTLSGATTYVHRDFDYDFAINGIPFLSAIDQQHPMTRKTAPYRKPPYDNSIEPGEQSLAFWWIKAQSSFHGGAGQNYIDTPVTQGTEVRQIRYATSAGVDPWTQGKLSLLKTTSKAASISGSNPRLLSATDGTNNYLFYSDGANLWRTTETVSAGVPSYSAPTAVNWTGGGTIQSLVADGTNYYVTDGTGIWKGAITTPASAATQIYVMTSGTAVMSWVKQRLMLGYTTSSTSAVYELNANAAASSPLPTAKFTHPNSTWTWTAFAFSPSAIYAAGYAGTSSAVYKFLLDSNGVTPTLTTGLTAAELPPGELIYGMFTYLGSSMALATSRGLRVAFIQENASGDFTVGPLTVQQPGATTGAITGQDRFLYYSYTDSSGIAGLARVDLSQQLTIRAFSYIPDQRFSWAPDLRATDGSEVLVAGATVAVDQIAGRIAFTVAGQGLFVQHPSKLTPSGSLTTSRIRYDTLDPKIVRYVRIRTEGSYGTASAAVNSNVDAAGAIAVTVASATSNDSGDAAVYLSPLQFATVTLTLNRDSVNNTQGAIILGYQLKALPAQKRQRFIQVPLMCFDQEQDATGQEVSYNAGNAKQRLLALEAIESAGDIVLFQTLSPSADNAYSALVVIEDVQYDQMVSPTENQAWGGIVTLTLRTVE